MTSHIVVPVQDLNATAAVAAAAETALVVSVAAVPGTTWKITSNARKMPDVYAGWEIWNAHHTTVIRVTASAQVGNGNRYHPDRETHEDSEHEADFTLAECTLCF
jgi:tryptophan 2,3-dioxygenase